MAGPVIVGLVWLGTQIAPYIVQAVVDAIVNEADPATVEDLEVILQNTTIARNQLDEHVPGSLGEILLDRTAVILGDTQELTEVDVPALHAAIAAVDGGGGGGDVAGDVWGHTIRQDFVTGAPLSAATLLDRAYHGVWHQGQYGMIRLEGAPDFALDGVIGTYPTQVELVMIEGVDVRQRADGQTIGAYLDSLTAPITWELLGAYWRASLAAELAGGPPWLVCLVPERDAAAVDYAPALAEILTATEQAISDVGGVAADVADSLDAIAAVHAEADEIDGGMDILLIRTGNTEAADSLILRPLAPREVGVAVELSQAGSMSVVGAVAVVITLTAIPINRWVADVVPPVRYDRPLGTLSLSAHGALGGNYFLTREVTYLPIPPDITTLYWSLNLGVEGTIQFVTLL